MPDRQWYYEQIKDAVLVPKLVAEQVRIYHLKRNPESWNMTTVLVFTPGMIVISGDLHPGRGDNCNGIICTGYDFNWFCGQLSWDYLAEKFLDKKWVPEEFAAELRYMADQWDAENPEPGDDDRFSWQIGWDNLENATEADALRLFADNELFYESSGDAYQNLPEYKTEIGQWVSPFDSETMLIGYTYDPTEAGWLYAIQRRFRETVLALEGMAA